MESVLADWQGRSGRLSIMNPGQASYSVRDYVLTITIKLICGFQSAQPYRRLPHEQYIIQGIARQCLFKGGMDIATLS